MLYELTDGQVALLKGLLHLDLGTVKALDHLMMLHVDSALGFGGAAEAIEIAEDVENAKQLIVFSLVMCKTDTPLPDVLRWVSGVENLIVRAQRA